MGTTPEPLGQSETSPQSLPRPIPARFQILGQYSWQSKGRLSNSLPSPGHLLPRSCHSRLPCPHPLACLGPRWGPTLRAWAPQRPREDGTRRSSRGKPALGGRCKQLMEHRAGRVERSGAPGPAQSPAQSPAPGPPRNHALKLRPLLASALYHAHKHGPAPFALKLLLLSLPSPAPLQAALAFGQWNARTRRRSGSRDLGPLELEMCTRLHPAASAPLHGRNQHLSSPVTRNLPSSYFPLVLPR